MRDAPITFTQTAIREWRDRADRIFARAAAKAEQAIVDPLFEDEDERLYRSYRQAQSVLIAHGHLIEEALVKFIGFMDGWSSRHEARIFGDEKFKVDCLAFDHITGRLIVFECKRGLRALDRERAERCDDRLSRLKNLFDRMNAYNARPGLWQFSRVETLIVSYYGNTWKSKHRIFRGQEVDQVFGRNLRRCLKDFVDMTESRAKNAMRLVRAGKADDFREALQKEIWKKEFDLLPEEVDDNIFDHTDRAISMEDGQVSVIDNDLAVRRQNIAQEQRDNADRQRALSGSSTTRRTDQRNAPGVVWDE